MWSSEVNNMILNGILETLYMTLLSTAVGYLFGLPMGVLLAVFDKDGLKPNRAAYKVIDIIANIVRSIPFLILVNFSNSINKINCGTELWLVGQQLVPLVVAAIPFIARMVESSLKEVDYGVIEAARAMGANDFTIVVKVMILESRTSLITGATIAIGTILGYSAMAGTVGGGGLGDIAIRYGYYRYDSAIMIVTVVLLVVLVQVFQSVGMVVASRLDKRK